MCLHDVTAVMNHFERLQPTSVHPRWACAATAQGSTAMWRYKGFQCYLMGDRRTCTSCTATQCPPFSVGKYSTARGQTREQERRKPNLYPPMHRET
jgi:hypothetical protein